MAGREHPWRSPGARSGRLAPQGYLPGVPRPRGPSALCRGVLTRIPTILNAAGGLGRSAWCTSDGVICSSDRRDSFHKRSMQTLHLCAGDDVRRRECRPPARMAAHARSPPACDAGEGRWPHTCTAHRGAGPRPAGRVACSCLGPGTATECQPARGSFPAVFLPARRDPPGGLLVVTPPSTRSGSRSRHSARRFRYAPHLRRGTTRRRGARALVLDRPAS